MSEAVFSLAQKRIHKYILRPFSLSALAGTLVAAYLGIWWAIAAFFLLFLYIGWITANLSVHSGKSFSELAKGIPAIISSIYTYGPVDLAEDEAYHLVISMLHIMYALIGALAIVLLCTPLKFYWVCLIGVLAWWVGKNYIGAAVALISSPQLVLRRLKEK